MPNTAETPFIGLIAVGEWTATSTLAGGATSVYNSDNSYTLTPWGNVTPAGVRETNVVSRIQQRTAMSAAVLHEMLTEAGQQLTFGLTSGVLKNLQRMLGLPDSLLTGDLSDEEEPVKEVLQIRGALLGSEEKQLYYRTAGFLGPRTVFMPRVKVVDFAERIISRQGHYEPAATFSVLEGTDGNLAWIEDAIA